MAKFLVLLNLGEVVFESIFIMISVFFLFYFEILFLRRILFIFLITHFEGLEAIPYHEGVESHP